MAFATILFEVRDGVARVTLNRPDRLNSFNTEMHEEVAAALGTVESDAAIRALLITGAGRGFCAGQDLNLRDATAGGNFDAGAAIDRYYNPLVRRLKALKKPVIAAVNGPAAGFGLALALGCDIRYAAPEAVFRAAFLNIGVSNCDMGTSWLLPRLIGASRSHELMLTARRVGAEEALRIGLVADVVGDGALLERARETATQIASLSPWGVRLTKQGMWTALELSEQAAVEYEDRQQIMATFGRAVPEATGAFLEKRPAEFAD